MTRRLRAAVRIAGFTTIELVIATALLLAVTASVAALATPVRDAVERSLGRTDLTGGSRFVLDRLAADLRDAGSPPSLLPGAARFEMLVATVVSLADLDSGIAQSPGRAIRTVAVPHLAPQGVLAAMAAAGTVALQLDPTGPCTAVTTACGFRPGMPALLLNETNAQFVTVQSVGTAGEVRLASPLAGTAAMGSVLTAIEITTVGLRPDADGSWRLVRSRQGSEQPVLDHVVSFDVETSGPDPLHITRVDLRLRVETASAAMRGPAGYLFQRAGTSARAQRWVPDVELRTSIAPRQVTP
jgi:hypothetical protein